jgi:hypothetical protein
VQPELLLVLARQLGVFLTASEEVPFDLALEKDDVE